MIDYGDTICGCVHWYEEHDEHGCASCECAAFVYSPEENTPQMIWDRGGEHPAECRCNACRAERGEPLREER